MTALDVEVLRLRERVARADSDAAGYLADHAAADLRADAERELAAMAERVDRIGKALEVE